MHERDPGAWQTLQDRGRFRGIESIRVYAVDLGT